MKFNVRSLFIDDKTLEIDKRIQKTIVIALLAVGLATGVLLLAYELRMKNSTLAFCAAALLIVMVLVALTRVLVKDAMKKYFTTKILGFLYSLVYSFIMLFMLLHEKDLARLPWVYLLPVTTYFMLGIELAIPILIIFQGLFIHGVIMLAHAHISQPVIVNLLARIGATYTIVSFVTFILVVIYKRGQRLLIDSMAAARQSEEKYREINDRLNRELKEKSTLEKELFEKLKIEELLLKEIHHRVKNNMQMISSLFSLEIDGIHDRPTRDLLIKNQKRIQSLQAVHESFYSSNGLDRIELSGFIEQLVYGIKAGFCQDKKDITVTVDVPLILINLDVATPFALLLNEIVTNSYKHAFKDREEGRINITMTSERNGIRFVIEDDGPGFAYNLDEKSGRSLGISLIEALTVQLCGSLTARCENGARYELFFGPGSLFNLDGRNAAIDIQTGVESL